MRTAEEIMDDLGIYLQNEGDENTVKVAINEARKEAIEECAQVAAFESKDLEAAILNKIKELK